MYKAWTIFIFLCLLAGCLFFLYLIAFVGYEVAKKMAS